MPPELCFDFAVVRDLQQSSLGPVETTTYPRDGPLHRVRESTDDDAALKIVDEIINENESAAANFDTNVLHEALLTRAAIFSKKRNFVRAKNDAQRAIIIKPKFVGAYGALCYIEIQREQFGRAEVALHLGLLLDPENQDLKQKRDVIRSRDTVHPDVNDRDRTAPPVRARQNQAGLDLVPPYPPIITALMQGEVEALKRFWKPEMRDFRYGAVQNPLMHFPILGLQRIAPNYPESMVKKLYEKCVATIDFLFERGCRLDERDFCGYTAVMHAAGRSPRPDLLEYLLRKGADPNVRNVFGGVALICACMAQNTNEIEILMRHGADPTIPDNDECVPIKFAEMHAPLIAAFHKSMYPAVPKKICARCPNPGKSRCISCRVVYYCGKACQKEDWSSHKSRCKQLVKSHKRLAIVETEDRSEASVVNLQSAVLHNIENSASPDFEPRSLEIVSNDLFNVYTDEWEKKGNMIVKIQVCRSVPGPEDLRMDAQVELHTDSNLKCYNESRSFNCYLDPKKLHGPELISIIEEKGFAGKGYFWAFMKPGETELIVITDPIHRAQPW